jgi:DNA polymerase-3 subunit alpha
MGKKKILVMNKMKKDFIEGCMKNGIEKNTAQEIFDLISKFASYGFNKSHSAAYALLAYQTAYLKRHFPSEFMAATLTSEINDSARIMVLVDECRKMGIEILPPNINVSGDIFEVIEENKISFALAAIKNVGKSAIRSIIKHREENGAFKNIFQLLQNVDLRTVNKKILEALIQAGTLDELEGSRSQNFASVESAINFAQKWQMQNQNKSQISLFEMMSQQSGTDEKDEFMTYPTLPDVPEWSLQETLQREKELLGFYISGHPLDRYKKEIGLFSNLNWDNPKTYEINREVRTAAIISNAKTHLDRKGNIMAFVTFEDRQNSFEGVVFSSIYESCSALVQAGEMVFVKGKVSERNEQSFKILCDEIIELTQVTNKLANGIQLVIDTMKINEDQVNRLKQILQKYPGKVPLYFEVRPNGNGAGLIMKSRKYHVLVTEELINEIHEIIGKENIHIKN